MANSKSYTSILENYWISDRESGKETLLKTLYSYLVTNDHEIGGKIGVVTGTQGSGKTTFLLNYLEEQLCAKTYCVWRGRDLDHISRIPNFEETTLFLLPENEVDYWKFMMFDLNDKKEVDVTEKLNIETYSSYKDVLNKLKKGRIHVVHEPRMSRVSEYIDEETYDLLNLPHFDERSALRFFNAGAVIWYPLFYGLMKSHSTEFKTVVIDEADDVFPSGSQEVWRAINLFKDLIKDFRKSLINFISSVHNISDIDHRIIGKMTFFVVMSGWKPSPILRHVGFKERYLKISNLKPGEFILLLAGKFVLGKTRKYDSNTILIKKEADTSW